MFFEILGPITQATTIAQGREIKELPRLRKFYGPGRWRKRKGVATIRLQDDTILRAELHWYEAHGVGKREVKIKRFLDD